MQHLFLTTSLFSLLSLAAQADEPLKARAEVNWRYGSERSILMTEFWVPIAQENGAVLYGDLRLMGDDQDNREGNLGLGYRKVLQSAPLGAGVAGVHGWIDRRHTDRGSTFYQTTLGAEWLGERFDILANGYLPLSDEETHQAPNPDASGPVLAGTGVFVDTNALVLEEAQAGFDIEFGIELGSLVDEIKDKTDSFRLYGGGYYFNDDHTESVAGWRARMAADVTSNVQIGARFQRDDVRGSQGFLEATFRFPFGQKKSYRREGIRARLDESPERDIDIVTGDVVTDTGERVQVLNATTGQAQEILHVDNTAAGGGDGSVETPFNALADAQAAASAHTVIYVHEGDGTDANQNAGLALDDEGQMLAGAGRDFSFNSARFITSNDLTPIDPVFIPATAAPVISNAAGNGIDITADNIEVQGVTVQNTTGHGISIVNADETTIRGTTVTNAGDDPTDEGIDALYDDDASWNLDLIDNVINANTQHHGALITTESTAILETNITNNTVSDSGNAGILLVSNDSSTITSTTTDNTFTNNMNFGVFAIGFDNSTQTVTLTDNTATGHGNTAFILQTGSDAVLDGTMRNNSATGNTNGIVLRSLNDSRIDGIFENNVASNNTNYGIYWLNENASTITGTLTNNTANNNGNIGIYLRGNNNSITNGTLTDNTASDNTTSGIIVQSFNDSSITGTFTNNTTKNNDGFFNVWVQGRGNSTIDATLTDNVIEDGDFVGLVVQSIENSNVTSVLTNNVARNNNIAGIFVGSVSTSTSNTTLNGNESYDTTGDGITISAQDTSVMTATLDDNIAQDSTNYGIYLHGHDTGDLTGTLTDNTVSGSGDFALFLHAEDGSTIDGTLTGNTSSNNDNIGILLQSFTTSTITGTLTDNTVDNNASAGIWLQSRNDSMIDGTLRSNEVTNNQLFGGIILQSVNNATLDGLVEGNIVTNNIGNGIFVDDLSTAGVTVDLGGGILGSTGNNSIFGSSIADVDVDLDGAELKAENNWWGNVLGLLPGRVTLDAGSTIDADPFLTEAP